MTVSDAPSAEAPPAPFVTADLWSLHADPDRLMAAAKAWRTLAGAARDSAADTRHGASALFTSGWSGAVADAYAGHCRKLVADLDEFASLAERGARAFDDVADALARAQLRLDQDWNALSGAVRAEQSGAQITFIPAVAADVTTVQSALGAAEAIRRPVLDAHQDMAADMRSITESLGVITSAWWQFTDQLSPFMLPDEPPGPGMILVGGRMIVNTGSGDDEIRVVRDPDTGELSVEGTISGFPVSQEVPDGYELTIRGGAGDDHVEVGPGVGAVTVLGSSGDDRIHTGAGDDIVLGGDGDDTIESGAGDDRVSGGGGQDYLYTYTGDDRVVGGSGEDTIYGGSGDDRLSGGDHADYLDGGRGADSLDGGRHADVLSGGRGNDTIAGGAGDDTVYTGRGTDTVSGGTGDDLVYGQTATRGPDTVDGAEHVQNVNLSADLGSRLVIDGSDEFTERVRDDLDTLGSSLNGQLMLAEMDDAQHDIRVTELDGDGKASARHDPDSGESSIQYNPRYDNFQGEAPPSVVLFHEMAHVYDYENDTSLDGLYTNPADPDSRVFDWGDDDLNYGVSNVERQATGLPVDRDGDGHFEIDPEHPIEYTENGMRAEMRLDDRETYGSPEPYGRVPDED
ncbi:M91 family zinc metallopeptidase [Micromonospora sp. DT31]|uniref:M91 family zinc metallopeptidase n=1 Tax=Micromonospora sp. DT31 TaxID=3393434 RepID=UPI003CE9D2FC